VQRRVLLVYEINRRVAPHQEEAAVRPPLHDEFDAAICDHVRMARGLTVGEHDAPVLARDRRDAWRRGRNSPQQNITLAVLKRVVRCHCVSPLLCARLLGTLRG
jgi:hypothetical protein